MQQAGGAMGGMNNMLLLMPLMYFFVFKGLPAGLPLYYTLSSLFRLVIMVIMHFSMRNKKTELENEKVNN